MIQRQLHDAAGVGASQPRIGRVGRGADRIERRAEGRVVIRDRHDHAPRCPLFPCGDLAPADGAEPGEEGRLAAPRTQVAHGGDQRVLNEIFGGVRIAQAKDGEAEQPGEIVREELVECTFIAAEHAPYQFALAAVLHLDQLEGLTPADPSISTQPAENSTCDREGLVPYGPLTNPGPTVRGYLVILVAAAGVACGQNERPTATTVETLLSLIQPWDGVRRYQYSNSHAILSGAAVQKVNGLRYEDVVQRDIFGPAGMSRSSFALPPPSESFSFAPATHPSWNYAAGGVTSTAPDMNRFNQALLSNAFGFGAVESFDRSAAGVTSFGMGSGGSSGDLRFTHTGLVDSYGSYSVIFPADRSSVVILCNFPSIALTNFVLGPAGIRSIMLGR